MSRDHPTCRRPGRGPRCLPPLLALLALAAGCGKRTPGALPITWEGVQALGKRELAAAARRELDAFARHGHRPADLVDAAYAMQTRLNQAGYAHAQVDFALLPDESAPERVVFRIDQGPRAMIGEVRLPGVEGLAGERERMRDFFLGGTGFLGIGGSKVYDRSVIDEAMSTLERLYLLAGYYRVQVGPLQVRWSDDRRVADLVVPVREGLRHRVQRVELTVEPADAPVAAGLRQAIRLEGQPFHVRLATEAEAAARSWLLDRGHLQAEVTVRPTIDDATGAVTMAMHVVPGPVFTLDGISITGNRRTSGRFIRSRLDLPEGKPIDQHRVDLGLRKLYATGLFAVARSQPRPLVEAGDRRPTALDITVEELPSRHIDLYAGWGSYEMLRGAVTYAEDNLFGTGRRWDIGVRGSLFSYGTETNLTDNTTFGPDYTLAFRLGYDVREEPSYDSEVAQASVSLRRDFSGPYSLTVGQEFTSSQADDIDGAIPAAEEEGFVNTSQLFTKLRRDTRDSLLAPSAGSLTDLAVSWSDPAFGADLAFVQYSASWVRYRRLGGRVIGVLGVRYITREITDGRDTLPIQERLFLGGDSSVRSFGKDELSPVDGDGDPVGGLTSGLASAEVRVRLVGDLEGAVFYDIGSVGAESWRLAWPAGQAIGGGLRYLLPVGPIRLDAGYNPGERFAADQSWAIHAAVGFAF